MRDLKLSKEAEEEGVAGGTKKITSTMDVAKSALASFTSSAPDAADGNGDEEQGAAGGGSDKQNFAQLGLLQTLGQRKMATKWQAKSKKTAAIVLDKQRVKEKYKKPPKAPIKPLDLWWRRAVITSYICDGIVVLWFFFLAFVYFPTIDPRDLSIAMDPLAWNMTFASTAVFIAFKDLQILLGVITWFKIWLCFIVFLTCSLFYGAIRYWMYIYFGDFPCFRGNHDNELGMCADGVVLIGLTSACVYNTACCFFLYYWRQYKLHRMKESGDLQSIKTVNDLLNTVDAIQHNAAKAASMPMIAGEAVEARRRGMSAKTLPPTAPHGAEDPKLIAGGGGKEESGGGGSRVPALPSNPNASMSISLSSLRQQHAQRTGAPVPSLGGARNSFSAGNSMYFQMPSQRAGDEMVHAAPRVVAGQPYVSFRHTKSQIFTGRGAPPQPLVGGNNTPERMIDKGAE